MKVMSFLDYYFFFGGEGCVHVVCGDLKDHP